MWGGIFVCCLALAAILSAAGDNNLPAGQDGVSTESPSPAIPSGELQQIAETFNDNPTQSEEIFKDDTHLHGGTLIFGTDTIQQSGDDSGGWWYRCGFYSGGGVPAESCEALIGNEAATGEWSIFSLVIDGKTYVR